MDIFCVEFEFKKKLPNKVIKLFDEDGDDLKKYIDNNRYKHEYMINLLYNNSVDESYLFDILISSEDLFSYNKNNIGSQVLSDI